LLLLDERDDRLAAVIYETGRRFDSGARISTNIAWISCQRVLSLAVALAARGPGIDSPARQPGDHPGQPGNEQRGRE